MVRGPLSTSIRSSYVLTKTFGTKYFFNIYTQRLTKIEDRQGHRITYNRDGLNRVASLVDSAGQTLTFTYHPTTGRLWKVTDPLARTWEYIQTGDNLTQVTTPMSRVTTYGYADTDIHNLTSLLDPHGRTTTWTYWTSAGEDRVKQELLNDGKHSHYVYYPSLEASDFYDTAGQIWKHKYSNPGMVTETIDPLGHKWEYEYNDQRKMTLMRDPKGREMKWEWDSRQNLKKVIGRETGATWSIATSASNHFPQAVTDALGNVHPAPVYDSQMNVTSVTDVAGKTTAYTYYPAGDPAAGLVETYKDRNDKVTTVTWKPTGSPETITDATGRTVTFTYDAAGRRTSASITGAPLMEWVYDAADRLTSVKRAGVTIQTVAWVDNPQKVTTTDASAHATEYTFDAGGRVFEISSPGYTAKTKYEYNLRGQVWKVTDTAGRVVEKLYDNAGRLWKVIEPPPTAGGASLVTEYGYDVDDTLISLKDPGGQTTTFAWAPVTLKKTTTFPDLTTEVHTYDAKGRMCNFRNRAAQDRTREYDNLDRLVTQSCPTCGASFKYDHEGRLTFVNDATAGDHDINGVTDDFAFEYDDAGRLLKAKQPGINDAYQAVSVEYTYDSAGRLETQKWPDATTATYAYDTAGRFHTISKGNDVWSYTYNAIDQRDTLTLPNGTVAVHSYDAAMRLSGLTWTAANTTLLNANSYAWNTADEITSHTQTNGLTGTRDFTHDGISRLKTSTPSGNLFSGDAARIWNYDANGNRTSVVTGSTTVNYTPKTGEWNLYDTVGSATMTYDANKNLKSDGVLDMLYDADNRLTDLDKSGAFTQDLIYDWMGRLIKKTVTLNGGSPATTRYYYSGWTVLAEVNESGGAYLHKYVHGPGIDELLTDETGGTVYHVLHDHLGSTTALITGTATVAQRYTYDPYGTPTIRDSSGSPSSSAPTTHYLYTGREYDALSGLYNYRYRFYHPGLGRFLQPDPIGFGGGLNAQEYASSNPAARKDPLGLDDFTFNFDLDLSAVCGWEITCGLVLDTDDLWDSGVFCAHPTGDIPMNSCGASAGASLGFGWAPREIEGDR